MRVAIVGMGPSARQFLELCKRHGGRRALYDEVWGINAIGDVFACDKVFHMDDVRIQEIRVQAQPDSNIAQMLKWLKTYSGEVITSRAHPDYPCLKEFPLAEAVSAVREGYFNSTAAYAVAYAALGFAGPVESLACYGMDFSYRNAHGAEKGRACAEFWLGIAVSQGIKLHFPRTTSLFDACEPIEQRFYGYDTLQLEFKEEGEQVTIKRTERETLPTAAEIEARYDHKAHPNPIVAAEMSTERAV